MEKTVAVPLFFYIRLLFIISELQCLCDLDLMKRAMMRRFDVDVTNTDQDYNPYKGMFRG